jgi:hypothetical protein
VKLNERIDRFIKNSTYLNGGLRLDGERALGLLTLTPHTLQGPLVLDQQQPKSEMRIRGQAAER